MSSKTKDFIFQTEEKDIFQDQHLKKKNTGGRPHKEEDKKLSIQKTVKFTKDEYSSLVKNFERSQTKFSSLAGYLRFLILDNMESEV